MRRTTGAVAAVLLTAALAGCGSDTPPGTLREDDLPDSVDVTEVAENWGAGRVACTTVNHAEKNSIFYTSPSFDDDKRAAVSFKFGKGKPYESVGSSVWRLADPKAAIAEVSKGLDECIEEWGPEKYQRIDSIDGYPDALGYQAQDYLGAGKFTRRILVPLEDRVVIVSVSREGSDDFSVQPEDLLKKAVAASADAPE